MQTFLPHEGFRQSVGFLDYRRLGKQRVEARQLVDAITKGSRWAAHPCAKMWVGHIPWLMKYCNVAIEEWVRRGFNNTMPLYELPEDLGPMPWFLGFEPFHASHRSNLIRKDPRYYSKWNDPPDLAYIWPHPSERKYILGTQSPNWISAPLP